MPPARHDGDGPEHRRDRAAARPAVGAPSSASSRAIGALTATGRTAPSDARGRARLRGSRIARSTHLRAHVEDRLAMMVAASRSRGGWSSMDRSTRSARSPSTAIPTVRPVVAEEALAARAAQAEARPAASPMDAASPPSPTGRRSTSPANKAHLRSQFGHWEGDLMHFRRQRDILLTLQERRSRLTRWRLQGKDADLAAQAIAAGAWRAALPRPAAPSPTTTAASSRGMRPWPRPYRLCTPLLPHLHSPCSAAGL